MKLNILHLSDLHYSKKHATKIDHMKKKLIENEAKRGINIHCIVFSGDLVQQPLENEFENAYTDFIDPIGQALHVDKNNIVFTVGNHDVNLNKRDEFVFEGVKTKILKDHDSKSIGKLVRDEINLHEHDDYVQFIKFLSQKTVLEINRLSTIQIIEIDKVKIGFVSLNTSLFMEKSDKDLHNLWLSNEVILNASKKIKDCTIKILNLHHSYHWFLNYKEIEKTILETFNMVLFGHDHEHDGNYVLDTFNRDVLNLYATSLFSEYKTNNGYSIYSYDFSTQKLEIFKSFYDQKSCIYENLEVQQIEDIDLTKKAPNAIRNELICAVLLPNIKSTINKYLAINLTSEDIPKDLEQIYIEQLIESDESENNDEEEENYDENWKIENWKIENIIKSTKSILIRGKDESGKTSLLNMINIIMLKNYTDKIPIYINSNKLLKENSERAFESYIAKYLDKYYGKNNFNTKKMILENRFIFLIDDIHNLDKRLIEWILLTKTKVIATTAENQKRSLYLEISNVITDLSLFFDFKKLKIRPLRKKECHNLTNNLTNNILSTENTELAKNVYKTILSLNLPSNPFIATLLTWMHIQKLEIKENEPAMIEVFLDYLLEKAALSKMFKGKFDFYQKIDLLAEIAYLFFEKKSFSIPENDILKKIIDHITHYAHDVRPQDLLKYFYDRRIFIEDNGMTMFSYRVFYYYFIAKYMQNTPDFVLYIRSNKEVIINMINELKYYASIKRDDLDFIQDIISHMDNQPFQTQLEKVDFVNMVMPTEKNQFLDYENTFQEDIKEEIEHKQIREKIQNVLSDAHEKKIEKYNYVQKEHHIININDNPRIELYLLNVILSNFIKQLDRVEKDKKKDLLNNAIKRFAQYLIYWENKVENKQLFTRFVYYILDKNDARTDDIIKILNDENKLKRLSTKIIRHIMLHISETAVDVLSTPKLTKVYEQSISVENNIYMYYFLTLIQSEVDESNLILAIERFVKYNKDNNLFDILGKKLVFDYVDKNYSSKTKEKIKSFITEIKAIQGGGLSRTGSARATYINRCHQRTEHEINNMKLII